jgi:ubiquinone/menaquinone biosynthesis C-methylase UbiE
MDEYARFAPHYDRLLNPFLDGVRRRVAEQCARLGAGRVLDICCGTARQAAFFQGTQVRYTGVDVSRAMLDAARKTGSTALARADGTTLPFADRSFDVALVAFALHEKPVPMAEAIMCEALRVARYGLFVDYTLAERNLELPFQWLMQVPERMVGGDHWRCYRAFMAAGALQGMVHRTGLKVLERVSLFRGGAALFVCGQA